MENEKRSRSRSEGERVYKKGRIRFSGGWERSLLHDIDEERLLRDLLEERVRLQQRYGDVSVVWGINGHLVKFTQKQSRSLLLHVSSGEQNE